MNEIPELEPCRHNDGTLAETRREFVPKILAARRGKTIAVSLE
jgi:hypothetical protein